MVLLGDQLGSVGDPDEQFVAYGHESGDRARDLVGAYALAAAGLTLMVFAARLHSVVDGGSGAARMTALVAAAATAVLLLGAAAALNAVSSSILIADLFDERPHEFGADASRLATQLGYGLLVFSMLAAALFVSATSIAASAANVLPRWLVRLGFAAAGVLLFSFFFLPAAALPLWVVAASASLLRRAGEPPP
jgi:hypothetical protein